MVVVKLLIGVFHRVFPLLLEIPSHGEFESFTAFLSVVNDFDDFIAPLVFLALFVDLTSEVVYLFMTGFNVNISDALSCLYTVLCVYRAIGAVADSSSSSLRGEASLAP